MAMTPEEIGAGWQAFIEMLGLAHRAEVPTEVVLGLAEVVNAVTTRRKPGELVIKITVKPPKEMESSAVVHTQVQVTRKLPPIVRGYGVYFVQPNGQLGRSPHNQATMFDSGPRVVTGPVRNPGEDQFLAANGER